MKRKVIQLAGRTLIVSLPSKWTKQYKIRKGDELEVKEHGKNILYSSQGTQEEGRITMELEGDRRLIERKVSVAYKRGFDELDLHFKDPKVMSIIKDEINKSIGFEIVQQGRNSCLVKNIAETIESEFDNLLRRAFLITLELADNSLEAINTEEYEKLSELKIAELTNDKFTNLCKRILNKKGFKDPKKTSVMYCVVWELEKIADQYEHICNLLEHKKKCQLSKHTLSLFKEVNNFFRLFYELFYKYDETQALVFANKAKDLQKKTYNALQNPTKEEIKLIHHLDILVMRIYEIAGPFYALQF
jgi:phosphate uptake regulator